MELEPQHKSAGICLVAAVVSVLLALHLTDKLVLLAGSPGAARSLAILGATVLVFLAIAFIYALLAYGLVFRCRIDIPSGARVFGEFRSLVFMDGSVLLVRNEHGFWLVKRP